MSICQFSQETTGTWICPFAFSYTHTFSPRVWIQNLQSLCQDRENAGDDSCPDDDPPPDDGEVGAEHGDVPQDDEVTLVMGELSPGSDPNDGSDSDESESENEDEKSVEGEENVEPEPAPKRIPLLHAFRNTDDEYESESYSELSDTEDDGNVPNLPADTKGNTSHGFNLSILAVPPMPADPDSDIDLPSDTDRKDANLDDNIDKIPADDIDKTPAEVPGDHYVTPPKRATRKEPHSSEKKVKIDHRGSGIPPPKAEKADLTIPDETWHFNWGVVGSPTLFISSDDHW